ncbi:MAG: hypothetical protein MUE82_08405 [Chloroflexi bacterium]|nr:hypothetical protein [Chloroflexota bacterium]
MEPRRDALPADDTYAPPVAGEVRVPGGPARGASIALGRETFLLRIEGTAPATIAYRDLATIAIDGGVGLLVAGDGETAPRWLLERWGTSLGPTIAALRERRLRQRLSDGLVRVPDDPIPLVEYALPDGSEAGVAHLVLHPWGAVVAPLDERRPWIRLRRSGIGSVDAVPAFGGLRVHASDGTAIVDLPRLGDAVARVRAALEAARDAAVVDAGALLTALAPDLPFAARDRAARAMADGRPAHRVALDEAWTPLEAAVLTEPTFAESYAALLARSGGGDAQRWIAIAPEEPGSPTPKSWFLVTLPGNLVALELVSEGAHATYCFRAGPRAEHPGGPTDPAAASERARAVSEALIDARFLREPMALPDERLARPEGRRYRLALAALPSLAAARAAFVARLVHRDPTSWSAALDDLIAWHDAARDERAAWPGRAAQEAMVDGAQRAAADDPGSVAGPDGGQEAGPGGGPARSSG